MWNTLNPGSDITGSMGSRPSRACAFGAGVAAAVGVLEHVELEAAQPELELLGERGMGVLDGGRELGKGLGDGVEERLLPFEVVGVVAGEDLHLVEPHVGARRDRGRARAAAVVVAGAGRASGQRHGQRTDEDRAPEPSHPCAPCSSTDKLGILARMPRAIWSGSISFGLVNIPIKLYAAVSRKTVSFNQLDSRTGSRIKYKKVSAADGDEVPAEAIVKGYELASGSYVTVGDDELAALDPEASRTIDIEEFVDLVDIDPLFYDSAYYVAPDKATTKPYALLTQAMEEAGKVGVARFVMRSKQYLCAIRPKDGALVLSTMVYADEVNEPTEIGEIADLEDIELTKKELDMARQLIASLSDDFDADRFEDTYRNQVLDLIERKAAGDTEVVAPPEVVSEDKVVDLMAALEASVKEAKAARKRHPAGAPEPRSAAAPPRSALARARSRHEWPPTTGSRSTVAGSR